MCALMEIQSTVAKANERTPRTPWLGAGMGGGMMGGVSKGEVFQYN